MLESFQKNRGTQKQIFHENLQTYFEAQRNNNKKNFDRSLEE